MWIEENEEEEEEDPGQSLKEAKSLCWRELVVVVVVYTDSCS